MFSAWLSGFTRSGVSAVTELAGSDDAGRRSSVRVLVGAVVGLLITGALLGALWVWIAPSIHGVVGRNHAGERVRDYLGNESEQFFVAPCLMLGLLSVMAVVAPVLAWQCRHRRGPQMVVTLSVGLLAGGAAATAVGAFGAYLRYGAVNIAQAQLSTDHAVWYFTAAPPVFFGHTPAQIAGSLLLPVGIGALVYALLVAAAAHDDLGNFAGEIRADPDVPLCPE
ncbi:MAG: DUF2567 domain-containing protein [Mycobacteriaceae bacterium]|nr:DUF2567 domain-containing protein [Mycobacteriaceae bacterium]